MNNAQDNSSDTLNEQLLDEQLIEAAFARLHIRAFVLAAGVVGGLALSTATALLLLKGAPSGVSVGGHLALLSNYLPGYSVSWIGSLIGLAYGFVVGAMFGGMISISWNLSRNLYLLLAFFRGHLRQRIGL
jgi:hypothetical protein